MAEFNAVAVSPLRAARKHSGLSLREFAELIPVSTATVSRWETGKRRPHSADIPQIADVLGLSSGLASLWFAEQPLLSTESYRAAENLRALRVRRKMTRVTLARYLGVSVATVAHWECGRRALPASRLASLARAFQVSADSLTHALTGPPPARLQVLPPLTRLRRRAMLTQAQAAARLGVSTGTVSAWERNVRRPSWPHIRTLQTIYLCSLPDICAAVGFDPNPLVPQRRHTIATAIAAGRRWQGTSLRETASRLSVNWQTVRRWELGHTCPPERQLRRLELVLGLRIGMLSAAAQSPRPQPR